MRFHLQKVLKTGHFWDRKGRDGRGNRGRGIEMVACEWTACFKNRRISRQNWSLKVFYRCHHLKTSDLNFSTCATDKILWGLKLKEDVTYAGLCESCSFKYVPCSSVRFGSGALCCWSETANELSFCSLWKLKLPCCIETQSLVIDMPVRWRQKSLMLPQQRVLRSHIKL